ncbi:hypothetical protein IAU60_002229 [Kwoniella sp. DSM 27419]
MEQYLDSLRDFPQDLTDWVKPQINDAQLITSLLGLLGSADSARARHTTLQAAAKLAPTAEWSDVALRWTCDSEHSEPGRAVIIRYCAAALAARAFPVRQWSEEIIQHGLSRSLLRDIALEWSRVDLEVSFTGEVLADDQAFCSVLEEAYTSARLRMDISRLLITTILDTPYDVGDAVSVTVMAKLAEQSLIDTVIQSLLLDTGNQLFSLNLRFLLNIIPYAPLAMSRKVPLLAIILGRAISWRDRPFVDQGVGQRDGVTLTPPPAASTQWEIATTSMESPINLPEYFKPRQIAQLFLVAFYGAWPSNVIAFTRDPSSYIQGKSVTPVYNVDWDDVWQPGILARRLEPMIREFRLHPSLVVFTSTAELADNKRWDKIDAAEFIARSQALANADHQGPTAVSFFDDDPPAEINIEGTGLERENELLRYEAKFAMRLRKQYLHPQLSQARTDASQAQQKHVKWQGQLRDKVASFREEKATWQTEAARIRGQLSEAHATVQAQREELAEVKNEDADIQRYKAAQVEAEAMRAKCYELENQLRASRLEVVAQSQATE